MIRFGKELYTCTVIPNRGAWLEYETDSNDIFYVRVDRTRKVPVTVLIRALGYGTNAEITELFGEEPKLLASFSKDTSENYQDGLLELYRKIRPGEPLSVDSAESLLNSMFFLTRVVTTWPKSADINSTKSFISKTASRVMFWQRL